MGHRRGGRDCSVTGPGGHILPAATLQLKMGENKTALELGHLTTKSSLC